MLKPMATVVAIFMPLNELLRPIFWWQWPRWLAQRARRMLYLVKWQLPCWWHGDHHIVRAKWVHTETGRVGEVHVGCSRCTLFWTESPDGRQTSEPRLVYWR